MEKKSTPTALAEERRNTAMQNEKRNNSDPTGTIKLIATVMLCMLVGISRAETPQSKFRLVKDTGWSICQAVLNHLESLPPPDDMIRCDIPLDAKSKTLREPVWEELNIEDHWDTVYAIETYLAPGQRGGQQIWIGGVGQQAWQENDRKIKPMDAWRSIYDANIRSGVVKPGLRRSHVLFSSDGPEETVLAYTPTRDNVERCKQQFVLDVMLLSEVGENIFLLDPATNKLSFIYPATGSGGSSRSDSFLIIHDGRTYRAGVFPINQAIAVERLYRGPSRPGMEMHYYAQQICDIVAIKPLRFIK